MEGVDAAATRRLLDVRKESCGLPFCQYSLRLGFRVPGLTLFLVSFTLISLSVRESCGTDML